MDLRIDEIVIDESIYPRNQAEWKQVARYMAALKTGAEFPPITVGKDIDHPDGYVLIDGRHRRESFQKCGRKTIAAIVTPAPKELWFAEAVRLNISNGLPMSYQERLSACMRLHKLGLDELIEKTVGMPKEEWKEAVKQRGLWIGGGSNARPIVLKGPLAKTVEERGVGWKKKEAALIEQHQRSINASSHSQAIAQLIEMIENDFLPSDEATFEQMSHLQAVATAWLGAREQRGKAA